MGTTEVHALLPDKYGVAVVDVFQLVGYLADGQTLEEATSNAGIDTVMDLERSVEKVRRLNETGDANAYWSPD